MARPRVLIADDEQHTRLILNKVLEKMNYEVVGEATNGQEAIDLFKEQKPHLVLLDMNMPLKKGDEVLAEIMADSPEAFVIILSSIADRENVARCIELGAANYILKDTPLAEMSRIIQETWQNFMGTGVDENA